MAQQPSDTIPLGFGQTKEEKMDEFTNKHFTHLKTHTQYSVCEGALRISDLAKHCKEKKIRSIGLCDSFNLCGKEYKVE